MMQHGLGPSYTVDPNVPSRNRRRRIRDILQQGFRYTRKLSEHTSCVNALAFSSEDGRWLASGGDDLRVLLWDFHQDDVKKPSYTFVGPRQNIFTLCFSASSQYLYTGDTGNMIHKYDMSNLTSSGVGSPCDRIIHHTDSVRSISCHPVQDDIFLSASEDGSIVLRDGRDGHGSSRAQNTLRNDTEFTDVKFHPHMEHIFATSDRRGRTCLRDTRMAFGPRTSRTNEGIVLKYNTGLTKQITNRVCSPEVSSVAFDRQGQRLCALMLHYLPTIYSLTEPHPLATCSGRNLPDGTPVPPSTRTYSNSCTIKHGSFGGPGLGHDEYYAAGSDDFRGYVWKIPDMDFLRDSREEISADDWMSQERPHTVGFTTNVRQRIYVPIELSTPLSHLKGHKSIVNAALMHPTQLHVVTAGIERHVLLHSPTPCSPCTSDLPPVPDDVRALPMQNQEDHRRYVRALLGAQSTVHGDDEAPDDDYDTIALFDEILRQEGQGDVFAAGWYRDFESDEDTSDTSDTSSEY